MKFVRRLYLSEAGATAVEYGLIAALIAVAAVAAMQGMGSELNAAFGTKPAAQHQEAAAS